MNVSLCLASESYQTVKRGPTIHEAMNPGKQGGKHGAFNFTRNVEGSYRQTPINYSDVSAESLWEALDAAGISCGVVNVPLTYPPSDLEEGFVVAGWPVPDGVAPASDEAVLTAAEQSLDGPYEVSPFPLTAEFDQFTSERLFEEIADGLDHHRRAFVGLARQYGDDLDVFFRVFMAIDIASHNFAFEEDLLRRMYERQDEALGELLDTFDGDTDVVLLSDHGHGVRGEWSFHVNEWLAERGYLQVADGFDKASLLERVGLTQYNLVRLKNLLFSSDVQKHLPTRLKTALREHLPLGDEGKREFRPGSVDWSETEVYSAHQNVLTVNTTDKPRGVVSEPEYESVVRDLLVDLNNLTHPEGDRRLVTERHTKADLFGGPHYDAAPDVVFIADEMRCNAPTGFSGEVFTEARWGEHRKIGALITSGPSFESLADEAPRRDITDVFPLVLALGEGSIPSNVDGEIPTGRVSADLNPDFRESRDTARNDGAYTDAEAEAVEEQLEGLGYLE